VQQAFVMAILARLDHGRGRQRHSGRSPLRSILRNLWQSCDDLASWAIHSKVLNLIRKQNLRGRVRICGSI